ncbi:hypothetical protein TAMA11512_14090 [Selenomonas sp. TAMA-11512]|uniref:S-layer homology domain-containing protein n=1 Tax=Selenomonas sp. TAMA-11512 TaxID=3095337 RepID=UPI0030903817|nr:hypothetical protein TAMA11512_14090 [Selenomonas sp. TAMA-11512]
MQHFIFRTFFTLLFLSIVIAPSYHASMAPASMPSAKSPYLNASSWAQAELTDAYILGIVPDKLVASDMQAPISRVEFASIVVAAYELLNKTSIFAMPADTFRDTKDADARKVSAIGVMKGTSNGRFFPDNTVSREDAAVILSSLYKEIRQPGWRRYEMQMVGERRFADDSDISPHARESVYFMRKYGVMKGLGDNQFAPKLEMNREQSILLVLRMFKEFSI